MSNPTSILLADDHPTFRFGLRQAISMAIEFEIVGEACNGNEAIEMIQSNSPDIAVVDWDMPEANGLEVTRRVRAEGLRTRMVILTMHDGEELVNEAVAVGVNGFVLKDHAVEDIIDCLRSVRDGKDYLSPSVARHVLSRARRRADLLNNKPALQELTPREREILGGVAEGLTSKEIAAKFGVSPRTVETHRRNLCEKLGLAGSHSLLQFAMENRQLLERK